MYVFLIDLLLLCLFPPFLFSPSARLKTTAISQCLPRTLKTIWWGGLIWWALAKHWNNKKIICTKAKQNTFHEVKRMTWTAGLYIWAALWKHTRTLHTRAMTSGQCSVFLCLSVSSLVLHIQSTFWTQTTKWWLQGGRSVCVILRATQKTRKEKFVSVK